MKIIDKLLNAFKLREYSDAAIISETVSETISEYSSASSTSITRQDTNLDVKQDYAITLLLWGHSKAFEYIINQKYPTYFQYECGLSNPGLLQKQLFVDGFYKEAAFCEIFESYTIKELSIIADSIGIPKKGKKSELIARILSNTTPVELHAHLNGREYYVLSAKGKTFLETHNEYVVLHKYFSKFHLSLDEYTEAKHCLSSDEAEKIIIHILKNRIAKNPLYAPTHYYLYQLCNDTGNNDLAMLEFLIHLYLSVNRVSDFQWYETDLKNHSYEYAKDALTRHTAMYDMLTVEHVTYFNTYKSYYSDNMVSYIYKAYPLRFEIVSKKMFLSILSEMGNELFFDTAKWNRSLYNSFKLFLDRL